MCDARKHSNLLRIHWRRIQKYDRRELTPLARLQVGTGVDYEQDRMAYGIV